MFFCTISEYFVVNNEYLIGISFESKDNRQECLNHINKITRLKAY